MLIEAGGLIWDKKWLDVHTVKNAKNKKEKHETAGINKLWPLVFKNHGLNLNSLIHKETKLVSSYNDCSRAVNSASVHCSRLLLLLL